MFTKYKSDLRTLIQGEEVRTMCHTYDLSAGIPVLTNTNLKLKTVVVELLQYLQTGNTFIHNGKHSIFGTPPSQPNYLNDKYFNWRHVGKYDRNSYMVVRVKKCSKWSMTKPSPYKPQEVSTCKILSRKGNIGRNTATYVEFGSGFIKLVRSDRARSGNVRDPYLLNEAGGYVGTEKVPEGINRETYDLLIRAWKDMSNRCYRPKHVGYPGYGGKGVTVCTRWHDRSVFINDAIKLPGFKEKLLNPTTTQLDKDHHGCDTIYSPETCRWLPSSINKAYVGTKPFIGIDPEGKEHYHFCMTDMAEENNLSVAGISQCLNNKWVDHKGWTFKYVEDRGRRFTIPVDQLELLIDTLKEGSDNHSMVCHPHPDANAREATDGSYECSLEFSVRDGKLDMKLLQTHVEATTIPYYVMGFGVLLHLVAKYVNLEVGVMEHTVSHVWVDDVSILRTLVDSDVVISSLTINDLKIIDYLTVNNFQC